MEECGSGLGEGSRVCTVSVGVGVALPAEGSSSDAPAQRCKGSGGQRGGRACVSGTAHFFTCAGRGGQGQGTTLLVTPVAPQTNPLDLTDLVGAVCFGSYSSDWPVLQRNGNN